MSGLTIEPSLNSSSWLSPQPSLSADKGLSGGLSDIGQPPFDGAFFCGTIALGELALGDCAGTETQ